MIQIAYRTTDDASDVKNVLYKPPLPISIESMAVHHITQAMVDGQKPFIDSPEFTDLRERFDRNEVIVAHNAKFDLEMLTREGLKKPMYIDTFKVAHHLDHDGKIPSYALQYLRYFLGIEITAAAHDAWGDVLVMERLFYRQLKKIMEQMNCDQETAINKMIDISNDPLIFKFFPFGKYKNQALEEVAKNDPGYLRWLLEQKEADTPHDEDWIATLRKFLHL